MGFTTKLPKKPCHTSFLSQTFPKMSNALSSALNCWAFPICLNKHPQKGHLFPFLATSRLEWQNSDFYGRITDSREWQHFGVLGWHSRANLVLWLSPIFRLLPLQQWPSMSPFQCFSSHPICVRQFWLRLFIAASKKWKSALLQPTHVRTFPRSWLPVNWPN